MRLIEIGQGYCFVGFLSFYIMLFFGDLILIAAVVIRFGYHHRARFPNQSALSAVKQLQLSRRKLQ